MNSDRTKFKIATIKASDASRSIIASLSRSKERAVRMSAHKSRSRHAN